MKKIIISVLSFIMLITISMEIKAADYMIGVRTGYYAWQPFIKEAGGSGMDDIDWGTGILYGPILSVMFTENLSFSAAALVGKQSTYWQSEFSDFSSNYGSEQKITGNYAFEAFRVDIDSALSYSINNNFKLFAGYKYQYMKISYNGTELRTDSATGVIEEVYVQCDDPAEMPFHGPAAGVGFSQPITANYFFSVNMSGLYMWGEAEFGGDRYSAYDSSGYVMEYESGSTGKIPVRLIGCNIEPVIGMNPGNGFPIVTLGFRYQRSRTQFYDLKEDQELPDKWLDDTLMGVFVTVVYMF